MSKRQLAPLLTILMLFAIAGCKAETNTTPEAVPPQETYFIEITDHSAFSAKTPLAERIDKEISDDSLTAGQDLQAVDWPCRILLTNSTVQQLAHDSLGSPPVPVPLDPISVLVNAFYFVGWSAKEVGKQAVNAGTPNYIVRMRMHVLAPEGTVWRIEEEIPLYTLDKDKSREHVAREGADKVAEILTAFRSGQPPQNAVVETNDHELKCMRGEAK
ncbi:hypothetical protein [Pseudodesulfovibrio indicus]|uniref:hypothetical protein n=1 Tax=Pseudodesulfovibrio indicus TaxID=1716143 RepID=UPI00292D018E|nr:hypothetical protein [Pseudodesulfovibrio indicus]